MLLPRLWAWIPPGAAPYGSPRTPSVFMTYAIVTDSVRDRCNCFMNRWNNSIFRSAVKNST
eukprot:5654558-Amphidinium_carterae.1